MLENLRSLVGVFEAIANQNGYYTADNRLQYLRSEAPQR